MREEIYITSPTKLGVRSDPLGLGFYGAPRKRGRRYTKHNGTDYLCEPGQDIYFPIHRGKVIRHAQPYDDGHYKGCLIEGSHISIMLFYVDIWDDLIGKYLKRNDRLGLAQDISRKYGKQMRPHIHLTVVSIDPELLIPCNPCN